MYGNKAAILKRCLFPPRFSERVTHYKQWQTPTSFRPYSRYASRFFYGIAFAQIYLLTKSILPGMIIHAFHDFCSFIGNDVSGEVDLVIGIVQTVIILAFIAVVHFRIKSKSKGELHDK